MANLSAPSGSAEEPVSSELVAPQGIPYQTVVAGIARPVSLLKGRMQIDGYAHDGIVQAAKGLTDFFGASPRAPLELASITGFGSTVGYGLIAKGHYPYPFKVRAVTEDQPQASGIPFSGVARVHIGFCGIPRSRTAFIMRWSSCQMNVDRLGIATYGLETARLDLLWACMDGPNFYAEIVPRISVALKNNQKGKKLILHDPVMLALYNSLE